MSVIGKGLLARISQSGDFFPTFCSFGPTPEIALFGPFLPGRGLKEGTQKTSLVANYFVEREADTHRLFDFVVFFPANIGGVGGGKVGGYRLSTYIYFFF